MKYVRHIIDIYFIDAAYSKEDEWKFLYVTDGPKRAKQKKLFYVYGKGMDAGK